MNRHTDAVYSAMKVVCSKNIQTILRKGFIFFQILMSLANSKLMNTGHYHGQITEQVFNSHRAAFILLAA